MSGKRVKALRKYFNANKVMLRVFFNLDRDEENKMWKKLKNYYRKYKAVPGLK